MPLSAPALPSRRGAVYLLLIAALTGARGHILAHTIGGRYRWQDWLGDAFAFAVIIGGLKLIDSGLQATLKRTLPSSRSGDAVTLALRLILIFGGPLPLSPGDLANPSTTGGDQRHASRLGPPFRGSHSRIARGNRLRGWYCPQSEPRSAVFVAHGLNANRENFLRPVQMLHDLGHAVLIMDFPAHGDSGGRTTTLGFHEAEDVHTAYRWLKAKHPELPIHALGYSMGASARAQGRGGPRHF